MSRHEWKTVTCTFPDLQERLESLQAEGFKIHTVSMDVHQVTVDEWYSDRPGGIGQRGPRPYNIWVILASRDLPAEPQATPPEPASGAGVQPSEFTTPTPERTP